MRCSINTSHKLYFIPEYSDDHESESEEEDIPEPPKKDDVDVKGLPDTMTGESIGEGGRGRVGGKTCVEM